MTYTISMSVSLSDIQAIYDAATDAVYQIAFNASPDSEYWSDNLKAIDRMLVDLANVCTGDYEFSGMYIVLLKNYIDDIIKVYNNLNDVEKSWIRETITSLKDVIVLDRNS